MSIELKREERYVVIKIKDLEFNSPSGDKNKRSKELGEWISRNSLRTRECVVVESDWPEYHLVWAMIEHRMAGKPVPDFNLWRRADALQALLTAADERADVLEGLLREAMPALDLAASAFKSAMPVRSKVRAALKPAEGRNEPNCLLCLDKKTVPSNLAEGYLMDCPDCCGEEG